MYPFLDVTYNTILDTIDFEDPRAKALCVPKWDANSDGELTATEVSGAVIPTAFFKDSGVVSFNEGRYFGGAGSLIDDCDTLAEAFIYSGRTTLRNLPAIKTLGVASAHESASSNVGFGYASVTNCFSISKFILSGRYKETDKKGAILARYQVAGGEEYYRMCLPFRGVEAITLDEKLMWDDVVNGQEKSNPWGASLRSLTVNNLRGLKIENFVNLRNIAINGLSENPENSIHLAKTLTLDKVSINVPGSNQLKTFQVECRVEELIIANLRCNSIIGSYIRFGNPGQVNMGLGRVDLPEEYVPAKIVMARDSNGLLSPFNNTTFVIRAKSVIPLDLENWANAVSNSLTGVYVPDELVSMYKQTVGWNNGTMPNKIYPLSSLI